MERAYYKCQACGSELILVTNIAAEGVACPQCGGTLAKDRPFYNHPMQALGGKMGRVIDEARQTRSRDAAIEAIVAQEAPKMLDEIELFLYNEARMDEAGGRYGDEEGTVDN